jgi:hypothetical protein
VERVVELRFMCMTATTVARPTQSGGGEGSGVEVYVRDGHNGCQADSNWRWRSIGTVNFSAGVLFTAVNSSLYSVEIYSVMCVGSERFSGRFDVGSDDDLGVMAQSHRPSWSWNVVVFAILVDCLAREGHKCRSCGEAVNIQ